MVLVNGLALDTLPSTDRGLHYGDGLFETIAVEAGVPLLCQAHLERLRAGSMRLGIPAPEPSLLRREVESLCSGTARGVLKVILTRGVGARGYAPPASPLPTRILIEYPWPGYPPEYGSYGIAARLCEIRLGRNPKLAGIKHLNRLENVLARAECQEAGVPEGLLLDSEGLLICGTMSNLFLVVGNQLLTPTLRHCGVAGVMRGYLFAAAAAGQIPPIAEADLRPADLSRAEEVFICNSLIGAWPVVGLGDLRWPVGPWTRKVRELLYEVTAGPRYS